MSDKNKLPHDHGEISRSLMENIPGAEEFRRAAEVASLMSDGSRLRLFWILCHCEECVINLAAMMGMSSPALSHHLRLLKSAGLVESRRVGKEVYYRASESAGARALHDWIEGIIEIVCPE